MKNSELVVSGVGRWVCSVHALRELPAPVNFLTSTCLGNLEGNEVVFSLHIYLLVCHFQ